MWSSQMLWPASWSRWVAFMVPPLPNPAVHLELALRPDAIQERPDAPDLWNGAGDEVLPPETGIDGHHEDEVELREDLVQHHGGGRGIECEPHPPVELRDRLERAVEVARALHVHGEPVRSRVGEGLEIATGLRDHEMRLERKAGRPTKRADDDRADRDVRHEVPVHDVDVNPVRTRRLSLGDLLTEAREVSRQDGGSQGDSMRHRG